MSIDCGPGANLFGSVDQDYHSVGNRNIDPLVKHTVAIVIVVNLALEPDEVCLGDRLCGVFGDGRQFRLGQSLCNSFPCRATIDSALTTGARELNSGRASWAQVASNQQIAASTPLIVVRHKGCFNVLAARPGCQASRNCLGKCLDGCFGASMSVNCLCDGHRISFGAAAS